MMRLFLAVCLALAPVVHLQPTPENECLALRSHRAAQAHGVLPGAAAQALLAPVNHQHRWRAGAWVRVLEGRPSAILAPVLALVDTNMGMRLRGCANTPSGWVCVHGRRMWWDDGEWHHLAVDAAPTNHSRTRKTGTQYSSSNGGPGGSRAGVAVRLWLDGAVVGDSEEPDEGNWGQDLAIVPPRPGAAALHRGGGSSGSLLGAAAGASGARVWLGADGASGLYPLAGLLREVEVEAFSVQTAGSRLWPPPPPCAAQGGAKMGSAAGAAALEERAGGGCDEAAHAGAGVAAAAALGARRWHWPLDGTLEEACGALPPLAWQAHGGSSSKAETAPPPFVVLRQAPGGGETTATPAPPQAVARHNRRRAPPQQASPAPQTPRAGTAAEEPAVAGAASSASTAADGFGAADVNAAVPDDVASVEELFRSEPRMPLGDISGGADGASARPLVVLYFSDHLRAWDAYWELYHYWTVQVLLRDVRRTRPVRVLLIRCPPANCTLPHLAAVAAVAAVTAASPAAAPVPGDGGRDQGGRGEPLLEFGALEFDVLAAVNAHGSPRLDPAPLAAALRARLPRGTRLFLLHQNHEQPWKMRGSGGSSGGGSLGPLDKSLSRSQSGTPGRISSSSSGADWRNGYAGGVPALATAYASWDGVLRQYSDPSLAAAATQAVRTRRAALGATGYLAGTGNAAAATAAVVLADGAVVAGESKAEAGWRMAYVPLGPAFDDGLPVTEDDEGDNKDDEGGGRERLASQRKVLCFFAGAEAQWGGSPDRAQMLAALARAQAAEGGTSSQQPLCEVHLGARPRSANEPAGRPLPRASYLEGLATAVLAPVPRGNSGETFRHFEALARGAIPVAVVRPPVSNTTDDADGTDADGADTNAARDAYLDEWCPGYRAADGDARGEGAAADADAKSDTDSAAAYADEAADAGAGHSSGEDHPAKLLEVVDAHLAASGCPVLLLRSWDDLPRLVRALSNRPDAAMSRAQAGSGPAAGGSSRSSSRPAAWPELGAAVDRWQQLVGARFGALKERAARDVAAALQG